MLPSNKTSALRSVALVGFAAAVVLFVGGGVYMVRPQWSSVEYRSVQSGTLTIPCILSYITPPGTSLNMSKVCAELREKALAQMLDAERSKGRVLVIAATMLGLLCSLATFAGSHRRAHLRSNKRWSGRDA